MTDRPKFVADDHLARLARLLRAVGYDTLWKNPISDREILRQSAGRTLLTRHVKLVRDGKPADFVLIAHDDVMDQLKQVAAEKQLTLQPDLFFTRCTACNGTLEPVEKSAVFDELPEHVRGTLDKFRQCPSCGKLYWEGSHTDRIREKLAAAGLMGE